MKALGKTFKFLKFFIAFKFFSGQNGSKIKFFEFYRKFSIKLKKLRFIPLKLV